MHKKQSTAVNLVNIFTMVFSSFCGLFLFLYNITNNYLFQLVISIPNMLLIIHMKNSITNIGIKHEVTIITALHHTVSFLPDLLNFAIMLFRFLIVANSNCKDSSRIHFFFSEFSRKTHCILLIYNLLDCFFRCMIYFQF